MKITSVPTTYPWYNIDQVIKPKVRPITIQVPATKVPTSNRLDIYL